MPLTPEQTEFVLSKVHKNWKSDKCEVCLTEEANWGLVPEMLSLTAVPAPGTIFPAGAVGYLPVVAFLCSTCGNIRLFPAVQLGIYPLPVPTSVATEEGKSNA